MGKKIAPSRRAVLKYGGFLAAVSVLGAPAIVRAAEPIKIGILQPFSGGLEALGEQGFQGAKLAIDEVNDKGGLLGRHVDYIRADDRTDPKTAVERTIELIQRDSVDAIIGPVTSANRDAIMPAVDRFKTPLLYATDYEGGVWNRYITCSSAVPEQWVNPLVPYVRERYGDAFFLVGSNYIWPQKMNSAVKAAASKVGARTAGEEYVPFGNKDFTSILRKVESSGANVLVNTVVGADAITLVKQFTAAGLKPKVKIVLMGVQRKLYCRPYQSGIRGNRHHLKLYLFARQARGQGVRQKSAGPVRADNDRIQYDRRPLQPDAFLLRRC